jgi:hypothetical protein
VVKAWYFRDTNESFLVEQATKTNRVIKLSVN